MSFSKSQLQNYRKLKENGTVLCRPFQALPVKPYWSSGKLLYSSAYPVI